MWTLCMAREIASGVYLYKRYRSAPNHKHLNKIFIKGKQKNIPYPQPCVQPWQRHQIHEFLIFLSKDNKINI